MEEINQPLPYSSEIVPNSIKGQELSSQQEYEKAIEAATDLDTWHDGVDLIKLYPEMKKWVEDGIYNDELGAKQIRSEIIPMIETSPNRIECSGLHKFEPSDIERAHRGLLFNGGVEACDGTMASHDTLPLTTTQIGVCMASYHGQQGSFVHRLFRKDFKIRGEDPMNEALEMLNLRSKRDSIGYSEHAGRGIMAYAERALLLEKSKARWHMGHGSPVPWELMTGFWASKRDMTDKALDLMRRMINHKRFVYIPSAPKKLALLSFGNALKPFEYLVLTTYEKELNDLLEDGHIRDSYIKKNMQEFVNEVGPQIAIGVYRASPFSPPFVYYAHRDNMQIAALIAMADSTLQQHRGFPMLIDIADKLCQSSFGANTFKSTVQQAYADAGRPFQYSPERDTR